METTAEPVATTAPAASAETPNVFQFAAARRVLPTARTLLLHTAPPLPTPASSTHVTPGGRIAIKALPTAAKLGLAPKTIAAAVETSAYLRIMPALMECVI